MMIKLPLFTMQRVGRGMASRVIVKFQGKEIGRFMSMFEAREQIGFTYGVEPEVI